MPIIIKDWFWSQTDEEVKIVLPFKTPKNHSNIDILTSRDFLKLHSSPYFWECFLCHQIKDDESKCQIFDGKVQLTLKKFDVGVEWENLEKELTFEEKAQVRDEAVKVNQEKSQLKLKETIKRREEKKKEEIMTATSRDAKARADYDAMIDSMKQDFKKSLHLKPSQSLSPSTSKPQPEKKKSDDSGVSFFKIKTPLGPPIKPETKQAEPECVEEGVPPVRPYTEIKINFTPRRFITPKRESRSEDENEWLLKQKDIRKAMGFDEDDLLPEEKNPDWLKRRGDQFFEQVGFTY